MTNVDPRTVDGFGDEWTRFDQSGVSEDELRRTFDQYFALFPWDELPREAIGFDLGCGSGRWARLVAPRVGRLHCIDASAAALEVAKRNLRDEPNCTFHHASVDAMPLVDGSMDFGYSLGVLHHVPDTQLGISQAVTKLKPNAPLLVYLYYAFDNKPEWFRRLWRISDLGRLAVSRMPHALRYAASQAVAASVYYPLARTAALLERRGMDVSSLPLSAYRHASFYTMRTDALDRFGTRLEQRFTRTQIRDMLNAAGLERVVVGDRFPFWCAIGFKQS